MRCRCCADDRAENVRTWPQHGWLLRFARARGSPNSADRRCWDARSVLASQDRTRQTDRRFSRQPLPGRSSRKAIFPSFYAVTIVCTENLIGMDEVTEPLKLAQ